MIMYDLPYLPHSTYALMHVHVHMHVHSIHLIVNLNHVI